MSRRYRDSTGMYVAKYGRPRTTQPRDRLRAREENEMRKRYAAPSSSTLRNRLTHMYGPRREPRCSAIDQKFLQNHHPKYAQAREEDEQEREKQEEQNRVSQEQVEKLDVLIVCDLDLKIKDNAFEHHTLRYHCVQVKDNTPVLRRGQEFIMTLTFNRPYNKTKDDLHLIFVADGSNPSKNLRLALTLDEDKTDAYRYDSDWGARIVSRNDDKKQLDVAVHIPGTCVVGEWELQVKTTLEGSTDSYVMAYPKTIAIIFNPWSQADTVYFTDEPKLLEEYIFNEAGTVFTGTSDGIGSRSWTYGQFEDGILRICFHLLRKAFAFKMTPLMANPVEVARALTRAVNSSDEDGLLAGNWSGDYSGGKSPTAWKTSTSILHEYAKTGNPVKYGQCWVFSHVLTAVCRALGLPCRSVTNFDSAHDTDNTCTIDRYFDTDGNRIEGMGGDSIWNFHVWNEVWILRPDLPPSYDGWHCIDATPQEQSHGVYQCGPCPVAAVKKGEIHIGYDTAFVFSEVNAEVVHWLVEDGEVTKVSSVDRRYVGSHLSTKFPDGKPTPNEKHLGCYSRDDSAVRLDVTGNYKFPEGSPEEREAVTRAVRFTRHGQLLFKDTAELQVKFVEGEQTMVGQDYIAKVKVKNISQEDKRIAMTMTSRVSRYWDCSIDDRCLTRKNFDEIILKAGQEEEFQLTVPAKEYMEQCDDSLCFFSYACARDLNKDMPYSAQKPCRLRRPDLTVKGPATAKSGELVKVEVSFTNPLPDLPLTGCVFEMAGGLVLNLDDTRFDNCSFMHRMDHKNVGPGKKVSLQVELYRELEADDESPHISTMDFVFSSKELHALSGSYCVEVYGKEEQKLRDRQQEQGQGNK